MLKAVKADEAKMAFINQLCHFELATGNLPQNNVQEWSEERCNPPITKCRVFLSQSCEVLPKFAKSKVNW